MPKIVILRGNSGSGKSTAAKYLQKKLGRGTLVISQDFVRREMLWVRDQPNNLAVGLLENLVIYGSRNCEVTILEGILYSDIYESLFNQIVNIFKGRIFAYYFDLPFEETLKRHKQKQNTYEFGENEMRKWWREKDFLTNICEKKIYKEMNLDDTIEFIYRDIIKD